MAVGTLMSSISMADDAVGGMQVDNSIIPADLANNAVLIRDP
jgi:hypothetical protein